MVLNNSSSSIAVIVIVVFIFFVVVVVVVFFFVVVAFIEQMLAGWVRAYFTASRFTYPRKVTKVHQCLARTGNLFPAGK